MTALLQRLLTPEECYEVSAFLEAKHIALRGLAQPESENASKARELAQDSGGARNNQPTGKGGDAHPRTSQVSTYPPARSAAEARELAAAAEYEQDVLRVRASGPCNECHDTKTIVSWDLTEVKPCPECCADAYREYQEKRNPVGGGIR